MITVYYNNQAISLTENDFIWAGGQGKVYSKNGIVYKVNHDSKDVIPLKKVDELSCLTEDNILNPQGMLYNEKMLPIGFTMKHVQNTIPLPTLFTTAFRKRKKVTPEMAVKLVERIIQTIHFVHEKNVLQVDGNEINYIIEGKSLTEPYFIDVDSYQTKSFPATVILPSVRDWTTKDFTKLTDWLSCAIVTFQIFIGVHPFKGSHANFKKNDIKSRMLSCVSVFNKEVGLPPPTRSFDLIPTEMRTWYFDLFEKGKRTLPPAIAGQISVKPDITILTGSDKFIIEEKYSYEDDIMDCVWIHGNHIIYTKKYIFINNKKYTWITTDAEIMYYENTPLHVDNNYNVLSVMNVHSHEAYIKHKMTAEKKLIINNRLYIVYNGKLTEIKIQELNSIIISPGNTWAILPKSFTVFRDIIYSNVLGKAYLYIPYKENHCAIIAIPELDKYKILDAKYENYICMVLTYKNGKYNRIVLKFLDETHTKYKYEIEKDIILSGINFISLPNNIYITLTGDGSMEIGSRFKDQKKVITKTGLNNDIILCHRGLDVLYYFKNKLYNIKIKYLRL